MLCVDALVANAYQRTQVPPLTDEVFREGLGVLVDNINGCTKVNPTGWARLEEEIVGYLCSRLQVEDYALRHPEVLDTPIVKPVFVLGMPRSGTTLLSYLLAADPARRSLLRWQLFNPVPPAAAEHLYDDPRCLAMVEQDRNPPPEALMYRDKHHEPADGATECTFVQGQDFKSAYWESHLPMPGYSSYLLNADMSSAYAYHKKFLQVQQAGTPAVWNLKMPSHALHIQWLLKTYPDARILWTHRDPYRVTGSLCSLIATTQNLYMDQPDVAFLASNYPHQLAEHVRRPAAVKDALGEERIFDVHYGEMVRDPIATMKKVYAHLDDDFTSAAESAMHAWLAANPQDKFGKHAYSLEQYSLSVAQLEPFYADYIARFGVEQEA